MTQEREGHQRKKQTDAPFLRFSVSSFFLARGQVNYALKCIRAHYSLKTHYLQMWGTLFRVSLAYAPFI